MATIEQGVVSRIENGQTFVITVRTEACEGCGMHGACRTLGGGKEAEVVVQNPLDAQVGDRVDMSVPTASVVKATSLMYLVPILFFLGGSIIGQELGPYLNWTDSIGAIVFAVSGLAISTILVKVVGKRMSQKKGYKAIITCIYSDLSQSEKK